MQNEENKIATLAESTGRAYLIIPIMLVLSVLFNISALIAPFYTAKVFLKPAYTFTLPHSVLLMWDHQFFVLALLILSFSILFPFVKLIALFYIWFFSRNAGKRERLITIVGPLGKWSMLDIFVTIILMVLTNDRFLITSSLKIGVYFFLTAIFLSMTCALKIETLMLARGVKAGVDKSVFIQRIGRGNYLRRIAAFILLIISLVALLLTVNIPVISSNDYFFADNDYSVFSAVPALWDVSKILTFFLLFTLVAAPLLQVLGLMVMGVVKLESKASYRLEHFLRLIAPFNMLDVFCLALFVFISEGGALIMTEAKNGAYFLVIFLFCIYLIPVFLKGPHATYLQYLKSRRNNGKSPDSVS